MWHLVLRIREPGISTLAHRTWEADGAPPPSAGVLGGCVLAAAEVAIAKAAMQTAVLIVLMILSPRVPLSVAPCADRRPLTLTALARSLIVLAKLRSCLGVQAQKGAVHIRDATDVASLGRKS